MKNAAFCLIGSSAYESTMTLLSPEILGNQVTCFVEFMQLNNSKMLTQDYNFRPQQHPQQSAQPK